MRDIEWNLPLRVTLPSGLVRTFSGVYEALDFLEHEWPLKHGERYERAVTACRRALCLSASSAVAREAFVAACFEAGMENIQGVIPHANNSQKGDRTP
ncbi:DNA-directed RNA polymerase subunit K/omega [Pararhizobium capsulatum DSM 1112]|uniref:DNA-directed RNA polymerase subunit K/omega n=1 Tax=Pararhizobium capsulatum DSM 1112 TaxID=1121113 RepID=A0ABU0BZ06_9HYPH|nr:DUF982 domain-containing protein [Pararhizobium capsulatum]MDQ0323502.1 DNA-directed RNA polymerase subunit K/omega [Pararhizobium capsulatum DSM 1112]